jgi:hypothetical protein
MNKFFVVFSAWVLMIGFGVSASHAQMYFSSNVERKRGTPPIFFKI